MRKRERGEVAVLFRVQPVAVVRHPQRAVLAGFVDQPHAAAVAIGFLDHRFREPAEESFDVGFAHEQIERELDDFGLHVRKALGPPPLPVLTNERGAEYFRIGRRQLVRLRHDVACAIGFLFCHMSIMGQSTLSAIVQKS